MKKKNKRLFDHKGQLNIDDLDKIQDVFDDLEALVNDNGKFKISEYLYHYSDPTIKSAMDIFQEMTFI